MELRECTASHLGLAHLTEEQADKALGWLLGLGYVFLWQVPGSRLGANHRYSSKGAKLRLG